jgi:hypothetical protein
MRSNLIGYCVAVASICLGTVTNGIADGGSFTRGCAARDMQIRNAGGSDIPARKE